MSEQEMSDRITPLATEFPETSRETWLKLIEKALKGADFEKRLVSHTADGIKIQPLYTDADSQAGAPTARPGVAPYTRGLHQATDGHGWSIEQIIVGDTLEQANKAALAELEGGANGLILRINAPGHVGIPVTSGQEMARLLESIYLDMAPVTLEAGHAANDAAGYLRQALEILKAPAKKVQVRFDLNPVGVMARTGHAPSPPTRMVSEAVKLANDLHREFPAARTILVDGRVAHEAGGSEAQELAFLAASLATYLRAFEDAGTAVEDALAQTTLALTADTDLFLTIAKLRAARLIVARIAEASGAPQAARELRIAVTSSARMMTKRDPWTNMLRTTAATVAAALGGADAITVLPYTWALGKPDAFAYRIARNTQIVAQEESSLGRVTDPAGGAWYVEKLTADLADKAWLMFQTIEAAGGILKSLETGQIQREIAATAATRDAAIAAGKKQLTGTSAFPQLGNDGITVEPWPEQPPLSGEGLFAPLVPHRLSAPYEDLRDAADHYADRTGHTPTVFLASMGTIADHTLRTTWVKNQLAVAGIATLISDGYATPQDAADAFRASGEQTACLCASDAMYAELGSATVKALTEAGAQQVLLAGRPGDLEAELRAAGVDQFLYAGQNAVEILTELQHHLTA